VTKNWKWNWFIFWRPPNSFVQCIAIFNHALCFKSRGNPCGNLCGNLSGKSCCDLCGNLCGISCGNLCGN
jgi:hypothetical protein